MIMAERLAYFTANLIAKRICDTPPAAKSQDWDASTRIFLAAANHIRRFLGNHNHWRIGVAANHVRHAG